MSGMPHLADPAPSPAGGELPTWQDYDPSDPDVCVWCRVPGCSIKSIAVQHGPTCPSVTGLWPVMPQDVRRSIRCAVDRCTHVFELGEYTAGVPSTDDPDVVITVCVPCSLLHRDAAWRDSPGAWTAQF